jgi:hypothetical protein
MTLPKTTLKMFFELLSTVIIQFHYFCQSEDVDTCFWQTLYSTSFIAFSALAKELGVVIIVPFSKKNGWCLSQ